MLVIIIQVTHKQGHGRITGRNEVTITNGNETTIIPTKNILIATGSVVTPFPGIEVSDHSDMVCSDLIG